MFGRYVFQISELRRIVANSPLTRLAALPGRLVLVVRHDGRVVGQSARWLVRSREHTNFTYDLSPLNLEHLAWWVSAVADCPVDQVRGYIDELHRDLALRGHIEAATAASKRRFLADGDVRYGRRAGWYAMIRALRPGHVVETGTDKGLGSCVIAAALLRNGSGRLTTIDVNLDSGYLIGGPYAEVTVRKFGDSIAMLAERHPVDFFIHDSLHTEAHERGELDAVTTRLTGRSIVVSDNAHSTAALATWAEETGRRFLFFGERPSNHWYPGAGIGAAWHRG
jgi:hypothetical protein